MKTRYHLEITRKVLEKHFSEVALQTILSANIEQDKIKYQFRHPHFHFDSNAFTTGFAYIDRQEKLVIDHIIRGEYPQAHATFGRITHTWQDYYSHSNFVELWVNDHPGAQPVEIDPADPHYLSHPNLHSGKVYGIRDILALIPGLTNIITPLMPEDSHAKMNLDSPASGVLFLFNYHASLKRTQLEFERILELCRENLVTNRQILLFQGNPQKEEKV